MEELVKLSQGNEFKLFIPMIGEKINLRAKDWQLKTWWRDVKYKHLGLLTFLGKK